MSTSMIFTTLIVFNSHLSQISKLHHPSRKSWTITHSLFILSLSFCNMSLSACLYCLCQIFHTNHIISYKIFHILLPSCHKIYLRVTEIRAENSTSLGFGLSKNTVLMYHNLFTHLLSTFTYILHFGDVVNNMIYIYPY